MSFSAELKKELCKIKPENSCCEHAEAYGLLLFSNMFSIDKMQTHTLNKHVADIYIHFTENKIGAHATLWENGNGYTLKFTENSNRLKILNYFGHTEKELNLRIKLSNIKNKCCTKAFIRGVFLSCGFITNPEKLYRLEFRIPHKTLARDLQRLIINVEDIYVNTILSDKNTKPILYLKDSEQITDLLAFIGANKAAMDIIQAKMFKDLRNYVNRTTNFETANLTKTATAAAKQLYAIKKIKEHIGLEALNGDLMELALLRLDNPQMSLNDIKENLSRPISKSGINHRFTKIINMANDID